MILSAADKNTHFYIYQQERAHNYNTGQQWPRISCEVKIETNAHSKITMAPDEASVPCAFDKLLAKHVPHIMEKIFFSLDYVSFKVSSEVCHTWHQILTSEGIQKKARLIYGSNFMLTLQEVFHHSSKEGNAKEVRRLLSSGVNPNCALNDPDDTFSGATALHRAAFKGHNEVVKLLLDGGADPETADSFGNTPLLLATISHEEGVIKLLLDAGVSPDPDGAILTPLYWAASDGKTELVEMLLDAGADPNLTRWSVDSQIHNAAKKGHKDVVKLLLEAGAEPDLTNSEGETPLHYAASKGHKNIVEMLLDGGADPNMATLRGRTPLQTALENFHLDVVHILIDKGARPNEKYRAHIMHQDQEVGKTCNN